jgi:ABC-type sugar transport system ATPase subunit
MSSISVKNLYKSFDSSVLSNVNLDINDGEFVSILGESGCGKTTLLNIICGIETADKGSIFFDSTDVSDVDINKRKAVIVDQELLLFPHMTVAQNIGFGPKIAKKDKNEIEQEVLELLEVIGLKGYAHKYPSELSGGEKQRVAIARGIIVKPKVLLLDETFSKLDVTLRKSLREFVKSIHKKYHITTILVTHDRDEAIELSDRIAVMVHGEIHQYDTPENIYRYPVNKEVSKLFGNKNYIDCIFESGKVVAGPFEFSNNQNFSKGQLVVRYEQVVFGSPTSTSVEMEIKRIEFLGTSNIIVLSHGDFEIKSVSLDVSHYQVGQVVNVTLNLDQLIIVEEV